MVMISDFNQISQPRTDFLFLVLMMMATMMIMKIFVMMMMTMMMLCKKENNGLGENHFRVPICIWIRRCRWIETDGCNAECAYSMQP